MNITVGFTYDAKADYQLKDTDPADKYAEFDSEATISEITAALESGGYKVDRIGHAKNLINRILKGDKWDIVFNICEGIYGRNRESQVPAILELYDIPYMGSDVFTMGLTLDKTSAKKIIQYNGISTAGFEYINDINEVKLRLPGLQSILPVIIKPSYEGTSKGISKKSICRDIDEIKSQLEFMLAQFPNQPILVERFIKGYEFTVAVIGNNKPEVLPPVQITLQGQPDLGDEFYTHARVENNEIKYICPAKIDSGLNEKLRRMALDSYRALECRDLGRIDFRVDYNNEPYFLECNPLPNLGRIDVFPIVAEATGRTYNRLLVEVLEHALRRYNII